MFLVSDHVPD